MIDRSMLIDALTINGLEPESSDQDILKNTGTVFAKRAQKIL